MNLPDGFSLTGAKSRFGRDVPTYDDGFSAVYVYSDSMGVVGFVRARTREDAYSIVEDEFLPEAPTWDEMARACDIVPPQTDAEWLAVTESDIWQESYGFRPNGANARDTVNHGIYEKDLNGDALDTLTDEFLRETEYSLILTCDECGVVREYRGNARDSRPCRCHSGFFVTYDIVTEESAQDGDVADSGFLTAHGLPTDERPEPMTLREALNIVPARSCEDSGSWWREIDASINYATGEHETRSVHPPSNITPASYARVSRILCYRTRQ